MAWVDPSGRPRARVLRGAIRRRARPRDATGRARRLSTVTNIHATILTPDALTARRLRGVAGRGHLRERLAREGGIAFTDGDAVRFGDVEAPVVDAARYAEVAAELPPLRDATLRRGCTGASGRGSGAAPRNRHFRSCGVAAFTVVAVRGRLRRSIPLRNVKWRDRRLVVHRRKDLRDRLRRRSPSSEAAAPSSAARAADGERRHTCPGDAGRCALRDLQSPASGARRRQRPAARRLRSVVPRPRARLRVAIDGRDGGRVASGPGFFVTRGPASS